MGAATCSAHLILAIMHLLTLVSALGMASQAFAGPLSFGNGPFEMTLAESDAAVKEYFSKLAPATKWTALHDTTGPEAGADVSCFMNRTDFALKLVIGKLMVFLGPPGWCDRRRHPGSEPS